MKGVVSLILFCIHLSFVCRRTAVVFTFSYVAALQQVHFSRVPWWNFEGHLCTLSYPLKEKYFDFVLSNMCPLDLLQLPYCSS